VRRILAELLFLVGIVSLLAVIVSHADYSEGLEAVRLDFSLWAVKWYIVYYLALACLGVCISGGGPLLSVARFHCGIFLDLVLLVAVILAVTVSVLAFITDFSSVFGSVRWSWWGPVTWSWLFAAILALFRFGGGERNIAIPYAVVGVVAASWLYEVPLFDVFWHDLSWLCGRLFPLFVSTPLLCSVYLFVDCWTRGRVACRLFLAAVAIFVVYAVLYNIQLRLGLGARFIGWLVRLPVSASVLLLALGRVRSSGGIPLWGDVS